MQSRNLTKGIWHDLGDQNQKECIEVICCKVHRTQYCHLVRPFAIGNVIQAGERQGADNRAGEHRQLIDDGQTENQGWDWNFSNWHFSGNIGFVVSGSRIYGDGSNEARAD